MRETRHTNPDGSTVSVTLGNDVRLGGDVTLGNGVKLGDYVGLGNGVKLGNRVKLGIGVKLGDHVKLGNYVELGDHVKLGNRVKLGDYVRLSNDVRLGRGDIICAGRDERGYEFLGLRTQAGLIITAGCRWFTVAEAETHWPALSEPGRKFNFIRAEANFRGWL